MEISNEIPEGSRKIYLAVIKVDITRVKYKKKYKETFSFEEVYSEGSEKIKDSYFMRNLRNRLELTKDEEEFKISEINKIKYIGFTIPEINE